LPEHTYKLFIKVHQVLNINFEVVIASLSVASQLLSVDVGVSHLCLPYKVHELVLNFSEAPFVVKLVLRTRNEMLVSIVNVASVKHYLSLI
jgi:hypothetical protein